jgi:FtsH-binding integral membrane protein
MINGNRFGMGGVQTYAVQNSAADANALMSRVAGVLCTAVAVTAAGCYFGQGISPGLFWPLAIATFACVFGIQMARNNPPLGLGLLYLLSALEGLLLAPLIGMFVHAGAAGAEMVEAAFAITAILMAGLGAYVWISGADFNYLGKYLMYGIFGLIGIAILSFFLHPMMANPHFNMAYSLFGAALFVGFTLYDFSNIKLRYGPNDYVIASVQLYLDFLNLFLFILRIIAMMGGGGSNRR